MFSNQNSAETKFSVNSTEEEIEFLGSKLKWVSETIILGITHGKGSRDLVVENYESVMEKLTSKLNMWKLRDLSLIGKIQILKTYGIS